MRRRKCFIKYLKLQAQKTKSLAAIIFEKLLLIRVNPNLLYDTMTQNIFSEAVAQRCSVKKVLSKILQNFQKNSCAGDAGDVQGCNFIKNQGSKQRPMIGENWSQLKNTGEENFNYRKKTGENEDIMKEKYFLRKN